MIPKSQVKLQRALLILTLLAAFTGGFSIARYSNQNIIKTQDRFLSSMGKIALSESELKNLVEELNEDIYWAGPIDGYF